MHKQTNKRNEQGRNVVGHAMYSASQILGLQIEKGFDNHA